jgi:hypothetical protein
MDGWGFFFGQAKPTSPNSPAASNAMLDGSGMPDTATMFRPASANEAKVKSKFSKGAPRAGLDTPTKPRQRNKQRFDKPSA